MDIGVHVTYEGFSLQQDYAGLIGIAADCVKYQSHNFQVYFEVEDLDEVYTELKSIPDLQWVHEIKEYPWGQRVIRIYDPDRHIVELPMLSHPHRSPDPSSGHEDPPEYSPASYGSGKVPLSVL